VPSGSKLQSLSTLTPGQWERFLRRWKWRIPTCTDHAAAHAQPRLFVSHRSSHPTEHAATQPRFHATTRPTAHLSEVTRVELVHQDAVVVLATGVTATSGVLPVLADAAVAGGDVSPLLPIFAEARRLQGGRRRSGEARGLVYERFPSSGTHHSALKLRRTDSCALLVCYPLVQQRGVPAPGYPATPLFILGEHTQRVRH
jgi:hypothetical protein